MKILLTTHSKDLDPEVTSGKPVIELYEQIKFEIDRYLASSPNDDLDGKDTSSRNLFLFSKPLRDQASGEIDWVIEEDQNIKEVIPLSEVSSQNKEQIEKKIADFYTKISKLIDNLNKNGSANQINMAKAVNAALIIPSDEYIFSVDGNPVVTGWGHKKTGEKSTPEILKLISIKTKNKPITNSGYDDPNSGEKGTPIPPSSPESYHASYSSYPYRIIKWFMWIIVFVLFLLILWLYLKHCSLNLPFQDRIIFNYCNKVSNVNTDLDISVLQNRLNQLEQKLSEKRGYCIADEQIESIKELEKKENNEVVENEEVIEKVIPEPKKDLEVDKTEEIIDRVKEEGGEISSINVILSWQDNDDLDLHIKCPSGKVINYSYSNKENCGGYLDIDMNSSISQSENPIENIFFELGKGEKGKFDIFVQRHNDRIPTDNDVPFKIQLLKDGKLIEEETKIMNKIRQNIFVMSFEIP